MDTIKSTIGLGEEEKHPQEKAGTEPISGEKGDESKGEPYDAGNVQGTKALFFAHPFLDFYSFEE